MEWLTILTASILALLTPVGLIVDKVVESRIREQVKGVETLAVRVDNVPSYQALAGRANRVRIASRGLEPIADLRIDTLEIETDPIDLKIDHLQSGSKFRQALRKPLQGGVRFVLTAADLNRALASGKVKKILQKILDRALPEQAPKFELIFATLDFDQRDRVQARIQLQQGEGEAQETLDLAVGVGVKIIAGRSLSLSDPQATLNGRKLSSRILNGFTEQFNEYLDARSLEKKGLWVRILQFKLEKGQLAVAGFVRVEPMEPAS